MQVHIAVFLWFFNSYFTSKIKQKFCYIYWCIFLLWLSKYTHTLYLWTFDLLFSLWHCWGGDISLTLPFFVCESAKGARCSLSLAAPFILLHKILVCDNCILQIPKEAWKIVWRTVIQMLRCLLDCEIWDLSPSAQYILRLLLCVCNIKSDITEYTASSAEIYIECERAFDQGEKRNGTQVKKKTCHVDEHNTKMKFLSKEINMEHFNNISVSAPTSPPGCSDSKTKL